MGSRDHEVHELQRDSPLYSLELDPPQCDQKYIRNKEQEV
jgi:hypothetical protein